MTKFRPCIDIHKGEVKQIISGTLTREEADLKKNYVCKHSSKYFAALYRDSYLTGGHLIMLGPRNEDAARQAFRAWPNGLQVGGGITEDTAQQWIDWGAAKASSQ